MTNWDKMMKLKTNKIFTKEPRTKFRSKKSRDWAWNTNNKEDYAVILGGGESKE
jgi:hypothetical protein